MPEISPFPVPPAMDIPSAGLPSAFEILEVSMKDFVKPFILPKYTGEPKTIALASSQSLVDLLDRSLVHLHRE